MKRKINESPNPSLNTVMSLRMCKCALAGKHQANLYASKNMLQAFSCKIYEPNFLQFINAGANVCTVHTLGIVNILTSKTTKQTNMVAEPSIVNIQLQYCIYYTVSREIDFPRYNMKCSGENVILHRIFHVQ